jgi:hypothetical protein
MSSALTETATAAPASKVLPSREESVKKNHWSISIKTLLIAAAVGVLILLMYHNLTLSPSSSSVEQTQSGSSNLTDKKIETSSDARQYDDNRSESSDLKQHISEFNAAMSLAIAV